MTKLYATLITSALILATGVPAMAGTKAADRREHRQQVRIAQGVNSGELTAAEVLRLERRQFQVRRFEARAKSDGNVTFVERVRLQHKLNQTNRQIRRQKHD